METGVIQSSGVIIHAIADNTRLQGSKSGTCGQPSSFRNQKGFTLVELAIVLVIVGLLVGMGATLIGPLTKRAKYNETTTAVKDAYNAVIGFAAANKRLPVDLTGIGVRTTDGYAQGLHYYAAGNITASDLCTTMPPGGVYLTVDDKGVVSTNIAFVVFSQGENRCNQTDPTGTLTTFTVVDTGVTVACTQDPNAGYDDTVMYIDVNSLRQQMCNSFRIVTDSLPTGTEEFSYPSTTLVATDGTPQVPPSYDTWAVSSGALPPGLVLSNFGVITGIPSSDGSFNFTADVSDAEGRTAAKSFSITINPNDPRITTEFLTYGTVNQTYPPVTLSATGGSSSYAWAVTAGGLPVGLALNSSTGTISGTPSAEGTYSFTITVTDAGARTSSKTLSIAINPSAGGSGGGPGSGSGGTGGGITPTCSMTPNPDVVQSGQTAVLNFGISDGPAYAIFSPQSGTCTTFSGSTGGSCTTGMLSAPSTFSLTVSNSNGSSSCSTSVFIGRTDYRVWNNTGSRYDYSVDGSCRRVNNGGEITTGAFRLNYGEMINRHATNNGTCGGSVQASFTYDAAVYADNDRDGQVNFTGTDR